MRHTPPPPPAGPPGTATSWQAAFPGTAGQLRHVRAALRSLLRGCPAADEVILLADELAANAIAHSHSGQPGGTFTVRLTHVPGGHVRAEVQDQGSAWHGDLPASARPPHGLYLVQALSAACGTRRDGPARVVWFQLDDPQHPAAAPLAPSSLMPPITPSPRNPAGATSYPHPTRPEDNVT